MADDLDALSAVREAVAIVCEVDPAGLTGTTSLGDLGADSLARVSIADVIEADLATRQQHLQIDDASLDRLDTLRELAEYVERHARSAGPLAMSSNPAVTR
jgi:acyl carrier protein